MTKYRNPIDYNYYSKERTVLQKYKKLGYRSEDNYYKYLKININRSEDNYVQKKYSTIPSVLSVPC